MLCPKSQALRCQKKRWGSSRPHQNNNSLDGNHEASWHVGRKQKMDPTFTTNQKVMFDLKACCKYWRRSFFSSFFFCFFPSLSLSLSLSLQSNLLARHKYLAVSLRRTHNHRHFTCCDRCIWSYPSPSEYSICWLYYPTRTVCASAIYTCSRINS